MNESVVTEYTDESSKWKAILIGVLGLVLAIVLTVLGLAFMWRLPERAEIAVRDGSVISAAVLDDKIFSWQMILLALVLTSFAAPAVAWLAVIQYAYKVYLMIQGGKSNRSGYSGEISRPADWILSDTGFQPGCTPGRIPEHHPISGLESTTSREWGER